MTHLTCDGVQQHSFGVACTLVCQGVRCSYYPLTGSHERMHTDKYAVWSGGDTKMQCCAPVRTGIKEQNSIFSWFQERSRC